MSREETKQELIALIEPLVENEGFELVLLEYVAGKPGHLNLVIDHDGGISIDHCARINRAVSDLLDIHNPVANAYTLEVSSPGLERPLTKKEHFKRYQGEKIKIKTLEEIAGRRKISGTLQNAGEDNIIIRKEDISLVEVPYRLITKANLWYPKPDIKNNLKGKKKGG